MLVAIRHGDFGVPGQGLAAILIEPSQQVLELQAALLTAVAPFTAPKGTLILCNTSGFHRGGFASGKQRVLATFTWDSPASLKALSERNYVCGPSNGVALSDAQRYALA